jgi:hypothetical protein
MCGSRSHPGGFAKSLSINASKNHSVEEPPEEMKFEYETVPLNHEPHLVSNSRGWHWISSIQGKLRLFDLYFSKKKSF